MIHRIAVSAPVLALLLALQFLAPGTRAETEPQTAGREGFFNSGGLRIRYVDYGEPRDAPNAASAVEPVLLLHGWIADGYINWEEPGVVAALADRYRVVAIDHRGHGGSDKPTRIEDYGLNLVSDAVALLDHLEIPKAHVVGYSMGGATALNVAARHPDRVLSVAVTGAGWLDKDGAEAERYRKGVEKEGGKEMKPPRACFMSFGEFALTREELRAIRTPMICIIGENDPLLEKQGRPLVAEKPEVGLVVIPGAIHTDCARRPEYARALRKFLDGDPG